MKSWWITALGRKGIYYWRKTSTGMAVYFTFLLFVWLLSTAYLSPFPSHLPITRPCHPQVTLLIHVTSPTIQPVPKHLQKRHFWQFKQRGTVLKDLGVSATSLLVTGLLVMDRARGCFALSSLFPEAMPWIISCVPRHSVQLVTASFSWEQTNWH